MDLSVIVEIPKGSRNKYEMDHATGTIQLDRTLSSSTSYPCEYGFVPDTLSEDGDPLDVLVLTEEPTFPGCVIKARVVGAFCMSDENGRDTKVLCVPSSDDRRANLTDLADLPPHVLAEISHFFTVYKDLEPGKSTEIEGWQDRAYAEREIADSYERAGAAE